MAPDGSELHADVKSLIRIPSAQLAESPYLSETTALLNSAFMASWASIPGLVGPDRKRYEDEDAFVHDMGTEGAILIALGHDGRVIASAGYKPWDAFWKTFEKLKVQTGSKQEATEKTIQEVQAQLEAKENGVGEANSSSSAKGTSKTEVVAVSVLPRMQKRGLSAWINKAVETELVDQARASGRDKAELIVRSGKENNEQYWTRAGYHTVAAMYFPKGDFGSQTGFTILDMEKTVYV